MRTCLSSSRERPTRTIVLTADIQLLPSPVITDSSPHNVAARRNTCQGDVGTYYFVIRQDSLLQRFYKCETLTPMRTHTKSVTLRLPPKLLTRIQKAAKLMAMAPSTYVRWCVEQVLDAQAWDRQTAKDIERGAGTLHLRSRI